MEVHTLTDVGFNYLKEKLGKMNKRADKLGLDKVEIEVKDRYTKVERDKGKDIVVTYIDFVLDGEKPTIKGYKMVAVLEKEFDKNIIKFVLGEKEEKHNLEEYREKADCDHCKHKRRRKYTYILQNEKGEYLQVGKTCLKDFLEADISYWVNIAELELDSIEQDALSYYGENIPLTVDIESFLAMTLEYVKGKGYQGSNSFNPTGYQVWSNFHGERKEYDINEVVEKNKMEAKEIVEWAKKQGDSDNTYLRNLSVIAQEGYVTWKRKGYVSSMVVAKSKEDGLYKEPEKKEEVKSEYVGEVGKRENFKLRVNKIITFSSRFGDMDIILFEDENKNVLKWVTSTNHGLEEEEELEVVGTVKKHGRYMGVKQTDLTRVKKV